MGALKSYSDNSLAILERLAKTDPWQCRNGKSDLSVAYSKIGDVRVC